MTETYTTDALYRCVCGATWYADDTGPFRKAGDSLEWAALTPDGWCACTCGEPFRILRQGEPIPKHPREHA